MMEPQIRFCTSADGTRIGFATFGEHGGVPMVAVPAWGGYVLDEHTEPWVGKTIEVPARHRRTIVYDRRGIGASQRDVSDLSLAAQIDDLAAVADAVEADLFDLWGSIDSAAITVSCAARYRDRVSRLMLFSPFSNAAEIPFGREAIRTAGLIRTDWSAARRSMAAPRFDTADLQRSWSSVLRRSMSQEVAARYWEEFIAGLDITAELPRVHAPTLVLHFSEDKWVPIEASKTIASLISDARFVSLEATRLVFADRFEDVALPFLSEGRQEKASELPSGVTAILFTDIAGSTALTERLGDEVFREKARGLDRALRAAIQENGGTPIEGRLLGDGVLATFASARQAIEAALQCGEAGSDRGLPLHVGVHAGDVIREEDNVYGGAVNIAARIASASAPDEVLVSQTVRDLARTSAGVAFEDRGERTLKGIEEPLRLFAVREGGAR